ncbi:MAG: insulinase family protein [Polyangiaceae bacterium]|nr:insulinase family protein [Polyangiaceae bacterium]
MMPKPVVGCLTVAALLGAMFGCDPPLPPPHPRVQPTATVSSVPSASFAVPSPVPESGATRYFGVGNANWQTLTNGLAVGTLTNSVLPVVHLRFVVMSGSGSDGDLPGLSAMTARLLKEGGAAGLSAQKLTEQIELLGSSLSVSTFPDRTVFSMTVSRDLLGDALKWMGAVIQTPSLAAAEHSALKKRMVTEAQSRARENPSWMGSMALYQKLFQDPQSPYFHFDATTIELEKVTLGDCKRFYNKAYVSKNMFLLLAGDVSPNDALSLAQTHLNQLQTAEPPTAVSAVNPSINGLSITVVDRPKSTQSHVYVGMFGPERLTEDWPAWLVLNHILGGPSGRLYSAVREKAALAYSVSTQVTEFTNGPQTAPKSNSKAIGVTFAATEPTKTALTVQTILQEIDKLHALPPTETELSNSIRFLTANIAVRFETVGALADEWVKNYRAGRVNETPDRQRADIQSVTAARAVYVTNVFVRSSRAAVVVVGDGDTLAPLLSELGTVLVVDPQASFAVKRTVPSKVKPALTNPSEPQK